MGKFNYSKRNALLLHLFLAKHLFTKRSGDLPVPMCRPPGDLVIGDLVIGYMVIQNRTHQVITPTPQLYDPLHH